MEVVAEKEYSTNRSVANTTHYKIIVNSDKIKQFLLSDDEEMDIRVVLRWQWENLPESYAYDAQTNCLTDVTRTRTIS